MRNHQVQGLVKAFEKEVFSFTRQGNDIHEHEVKEMCLRGIAINTVIFDQGMFHSIIPLAKLKST